MIDIKLELGGLLKNVENKVNELDKGYVKYLDRDLVFSDKITYNTSFFTVYYNNPIITKYNSIVWDAIEICGDYNLEKIKIVQEILSNHDFVLLNKFERFFQIYNVLNILHYVQPTYEFFVQNKLYNTWKIDSNHVIIEQDKKYYSQHGDTSLININSVFYNTDDENMFIQTKNRIKTKYLDVTFLENVYGYFYDAYYNEIDLYNINYEEHINTSLHDILYKNYIEYTLKLLDRYFESDKKHYIKNNNESK